MKNTRRVLQAGAWMMTAGLCMAPVMTTYAAETDSRIEKAVPGTAGANAAWLNDLANGDIVDESRTGSLTIHKYDITGAEADGVYERGTYKATGEADQRVEKALEDYAIEGVQFSYLRVGSVETQSVRTGAGQSIRLVYEIPEDLAEILHLAKSDAVDMSKAAKPCSRGDLLHYTDTQIQEAMADLLKADDVAAKNALENYIYEYGTLDSTTDQQLKRGAVSMEKTDAAGYTSAENLPLGLYLLVETEVPEEVTETVDPWLVQLPFTNISANSSSDEGGEQWLYDMTCYPKDQTGNPTLDKSVRNADLRLERGIEEPGMAAPVGDAEDGLTYHSTATASEGDVLDYILVSRLPHITSSATYLSEYTFIDRLSAGLSYNRDVKIAFYHDGENAKINHLAAADLVWDLSDGEDSDCAGISVEELEGGVTRLNVSLKEKGLAALNGTDGASGFSDCYMVVSYTATAHTDDSLILGDEGNPNDVRLVWSRTSDSYYDVLEDRNYVYSYALDLTKRFSDEKGSFSAVRFRLYNADHDTYVTARNEGDGIYHVTGSTAAEAEATEFTLNTATGELVINGLEGDHYQLTETATDDGYSLLKEPIRIDIETAEREVTPSAITGHERKTAMVEGDLTPASASVDGVEIELEARGTSAHAEADLSVTNSRNFTLPQTGGSGLYTMTILGVLSVAGGCVLVSRKKREE